MDFVTAALQYSTRQGSAPTSTKRMGFSYAHISRAKCAARSCASHGCTCQKKQQPIDTGPHQVTEQAEGQAVNRVTPEVRTTGNSQSEDTTGQWERTSACGAFTQASSTLRDTSSAMLHRILVCGNGTHGDQYGLSRCHVDVGQMPLAQMGQASPA